MSNTQDVTVTSADPEAAGKETAHAVAAAAPPPEHILQFFAYEHLPPNLQPVSQAFYVMANSLVREIPRNPERTVALRKLLESKDAAVRAALAK